MFIKQMSSVSVLSFCFCRWLIDFILINKNWIYLKTRYLRAALLPNTPQSVRTSLVSGGVLKPVFGDSFTVPIPLNKIYTKTLQVNVLIVVGQREEIIVSLF